MIDREHLVNCRSLFEWDPESITEILNMLTPESVRIDLVSSRLSKPTPDEGLTGRPKRPPVMEKYTGAQYWVDPIPGAVFDGWKAVMSGQATVGYLIEDEGEKFPRSLSLPPRNPFITSEFTLLSNYTPNTHPLLGVDLKLKRDRRGARKSQYERVENGHVVAYSREDNCLLVRYPDLGVSRWHRIDDETTDAKPNRGFLSKKSTQHITLDNGRTTAKVVTKDSEEDTADNQENDDDDVVGSLGVWSSFPKIPTQSPMPTLVPDSDELISLWYLYDLSFRSPSVELYISFATPVLAESALSSSLADLLAVMIFESLNQESYLAYISELNFQIDVSGGVGIQLHISGFAHKVPDLLSVVIKRMLTFGDSDHVQDNPLFYAHLEALIIDYTNAASRFRSSSHVSSVMFEILCKDTFSPEAKASAAKDITPEMLLKFAKRYVDELWVIDAMMNPCAAESLPSAALKAWYRAM